MAVVRALFTGSITPTVNIYEGEVWDADDPIVKSYPQHFSDDLGPIARRTVAPSPVIEEATAEPGAKRRTSTSANK